jgi:hypothetical protein
VCTELHISEIADEILAERPSHIAPCSRREEQTMPKGKTPGPSIHNPKVYEALRKEGMSKEKAAKISNAQGHKAKGAKKT